MSDGPGGTAGAAGRAMTDHAIALQLELRSGVAAGRTRLTRAEWWAVLRTMPAADARAVVLTYLHGMTEEQVAERLEVSRTRVWQRLRRAVRRLAAGPAAEAFAEACR